MKPVDSAHAPAGTSGHVALDFLNTGAGPRKPDDLSAPGAALAWMTAAALLDEQDLEALGRRPRDELIRTEAELRRLRDGVRGVLETVRPDGWAAALAGSRDFDRWLEGDDSRVFSEAPGGRFVARRRPRWRTAAPLLAVVAGTVLDLLATASPGRIRACAAPDCVQFFLDRTAANRRRWCSMQQCGNRAKVADLRLRRAAAGR